MTMNPVNPPNPIEYYEVNGVFFRKTTLDSFVFDEVYTHNTYEIDSFIASDVVIDIGANAGYFSKLCIDRGCKNILAFEPEPENLELLKQNLSRYDGCHIYDLAVWKCSGTTLDFYALPRRANTGLGGFYKNPLATDNDHAVIKVPTISLDDILKNIERVSVLKIDVEGAEYEILANSSLLGRVDTIVGEYHHDRTEFSFGDLKNILDEKGFSIYKTKINYDMKGKEGVFFAKNNRSV